MKAIIVAAGPGSRLNEFTRERPKCLLDVGGRTIMERTLDSLRENGIEDIAVVRGYCSHLINYPGVTYYENPDYENNNILRSLFYAEEAMDDDFIFSYSDIVYSGETVAQLMSSRSDICLTVDRSWMQRYEGRDQHPVPEAELVQVQDGRVVRIGKRIVPPKDAHGEFIGLARFTKQAAGAMRAAFRRAAANHGPFQRAASVEKAYMTDMVQELIDTGSTVHSSDIYGGWMEIDTPQDLERAQKLFEAEQG